MPAFPFPTCPLSSSFAQPVKRIHDEQDVSTFHKSIAFSRLSAFIRLINDAVPTHFNDESIPQSQHVTGLVNLLDEAASWISNFPPDTGPRRFGNIAFRKWMDHLITSTPALLLRHLPDNLEPAIVELCPYFTGAFGSGQRLDYGTGHELSFCAFLCALYMLRVLIPTNDDVAVVLKVFDKYFQLIRALVTAYNLEPAGSRGVWGLDDHSFMPYLLGSSQLRQSSISPADITNPRIVERERNRNHYFGAVGFINDVKRGPFYEHSPILYDISGIPNWEKINQESSFLKLT